MKKVYILKAQDFRDELNWDIVGVFSNNENADKFKNQLEKNTSFASCYCIDEYEVMV
jgi:hypothetical protein